MPRQYVRKERAAERVGAYLWQNRDNVVSMDDIMEGTGLSYGQVHGAETLLKEFVSTNADRFQGYMLYIAIGNSGEHGFIRETEMMVADQIARAKYMLSRQRSELNYTAQAAQRILDDTVSRKLSRALVAYEGSAAMLEDVLEKAQEALVS
jgi:hypothetical protein